MRILASLTVLLLLAVSAVAQPSRGGIVDTRILAGQKLSVRDEMLRSQWPTFIITSSPNPLIITNVWEGQYFVNTNMIVSLPNPTNNYPRKFSFMPMGTNTLTVSNGQGGGLTIVSSNVVGTICLINSNRMAMAWSSGTNWLLLP